MADIQLVIKIPEEVKNRLCFGVTYPKDIHVVCEALNDSTPLPKGHGRLIDADDLDVTTITTDDYSGNEILDVILKEDLDDEPTIIEADTAEREEV